MSNFEIFHKQHESDFMAGFEAKMEEIKGMGFVASRDKFNHENPIGCSFSNLGAYYYAKGEFEAIVQSAR